jgi:hypothetical protein
MQVPVHLFLIQHLKNRGPTRLQRAGEQAPAGQTAREKPEGARRTPTPFQNAGQ